MALDVGIDTSMANKLANANLRWALMGSTGVTGRLVLDEALRRGHRPALVGRDRRKLRQLADPHDLETFAFDLTDTVPLTHFLDGRPVLNAAGPYALTAGPMIEAALRGGTDLIDLSGELDVVASTLKRNTLAQQSGSVLITGAGFGVAASDGLALQIIERLGGAEWMRVSVSAQSAYSSPAVGESVIGVLAGGGFEVVAGQLVPRPIGSRRWSEVASNGGRLSFGSAPLAELAALSHVADVPHIVAGVPMPAAQAMAMGLLSPALKLILKWPSARRVFSKTGGHSASGGSQKEFISEVWIEARHGTKRATGHLVGGEGYALAASIAVSTVEALAARRPKPGAYTPGSAFGAHFIDAVGRIQIEISQQ